MPLNHFSNKWCHLPKDFSETTLLLPVTINVTSTSFEMIKVDLIYVIDLKKLEIRK